MLASLIFSNMRSRHSRVQLCSIHQRKQNVEPAAVAHYPNFPIIFGTMFFFLSEVPPFRVVPVSLSHNVGMHQKP